MAHGSPPIPAGTFPFTRKGRVSCGIPNPARTDLMESLAPQPGDVKMRIDSPVVGVRESALPLTAYENENRQDLSDSTNDECQRSHGYDLRQAVGARGRPAWPDRWPRNEGADCPSTLFAARHQFAFWFAQSVAVTTLARTGRSRVARGDRATAIAAPGRVRRLNHPPCRGGRKWGRHLPSTRAHSGRVTPWRVPTTAAFAGANLPWAALR